MQEDRPETPRAGWRSKRGLLGGTAALVVVGLVFAFVLPQIADYRDVWDVLKTLELEGRGSFSPVATLLNLVTFAPPWMAALPGLRFRQAFVMSQASTALSIVAPAGAAVGMAGSFTMLRSWGFAAAPVGLAVAVTGIWNQLSTLAFPIVGLALLTREDESHALLRTTALIGVAVLIVVIAGFALALSSRQRAVRIGELAARLAEPRVPASSAQAQGDLGRREPRCASARRRSSCSAVAGTCSRSRRSPAISRSSSCSSPASRPSATPRLR